VYSISADEIPAIAAQSLRASSMKGNPVSLPAAVLEDILRAAW
jgi:alcohol dehydrogenase class IV